MRTAGSIAGRAGGRSPTILQAGRNFYSKPLGWMSMISVSAVLAYCGGGVMFWLHAIYRGERGPAIDHLQHWVLDSTLGFLALTPIVFVLLPASLLRLGDDADRSSSRNLARYVLTVGTLFALVTGPGPFLHNTLVGQGTPLGDAATSVFGHDPDIAAHNAHAPEQSALTAGILQVAIGVPSYSLLTLASVMAVRAATRIGRREHDSWLTSSPRGGEAKWS